MTSTSPYGLLDRLLHRVALTPHVQRIWFEIERGRFGSAASAAESGAPIFICSLARGGTSVLVRLLHGTGCFASATYGDLPFPLAPNLNLHLFPRATLAATARNHGDKLSHDLATPEAIEEVFWRVHDGKTYLVGKRLVPYKPTADTLRSFAEYMALIRLRYGAPRYLGKNNSNVLRVSALANVFPNAVFLHPFRDPVQQAASLLNQHLRARAAAILDPFRIDYMRLLGHFDFGADHRAPVLPDFDPSAFASTTIEYWLALWAAVYEHLLRTNPNGLFVDFDQFATAEGLSRLQNALGMNISDTVGLEKPQPYGVTVQPSPILERVAVTHAHLLEAASHG